MAEERKKVIERREVVVNLPVIKAPGWLQGFVDFFREQGVVGVAVGLILGLAAKSLVDSFVTNFVNPTLGVILGGTDLARKFVCVQYTNSVCASKIGYGRFISDLISFIIIAFIVYILVKMLKLERLDKKRE